MSSINPSVGLALTAPATRKYRKEIAANGGKRACALSDLSVIKTHRGDTFETAITGRRIEVCPDRRGHHAKRL